MYVYYVPSFLPYFLIPQTDKVTNSLSLLLLAQGSPDIFFMQISSKLKGTIELNFPRVKAKLPMTLFLMSHIFGLACLLASIICLLD